MQDEVLDGHELALEPEAGAGVVKMGAADPALPDRGRAQAFVEPGERILGGGERTLKRRRPAPVQRFGGRSGRPHAKSAPMSIARPGTPEGKSDPLVCRSRDS